jgi:uncharacterized protein (DUF1697 family)
LTAYVALLRGINVGGHRVIAMADLRELLRHLGLSDVTSFLQSGNLVFRAESRSTVQMERLLEAGAGKRLGLRTDFFVRSARDLNAAIARNPLRHEAEEDPGHFLVLFLKDAPAAGAVEALKAAITGPEVLRADGRHVYVVYPAGIGRSRLTNTLIEKTLGTRVTGRNWNTVLKLAALATI